MAKKRAAVVFIHGLSKKPAPAELQKIWLWALERDTPMPTVYTGPNKGLRLGTNNVESRFCYYADVFYGTDYEKDLRSYYENNTAESDLKADGLDGLSEDFPEAAGVTPREQTFLHAFEAKLAANLVLTDPAEAAAAASTEPGYEIAGLLPKVVQRAVIKKAAMEAYYYLFDKVFKRADGVSFHVRKDLRNKLMDTLAAASAEAEKVILISHSMGTMVAYDVLRNCPECVQVDTLITLGSPLGIREVQEELIASGEKSVDFPAAKLGAWINIYDPLDPICGADPRFANDYRSVEGKSIVDIKESNWGSWRHTITHYLAGVHCRRAIARAVGINRD